MSIYICMCVCVCVCIYIYTFIECSITICQRKDVKGKKILNGDLY